MYPFLPSASASGAWKVLARDEQPYQRGSNRYGGMPSEDVSLDVAGGTYEGRLDTPEVDGDGADIDTTDAGILVVPGAGHGPFGDVFDRFADAAAGSGFTVARFDTWPTRDDLAAKTDEDHATEIREGIDYLHDSGCSTVHVVAKSYGGRLALELVPEHAPESVDRMVLWAPAIIFDEHPEAPTIQADDLADIEIPVRILQGDEDHIPVESAASIANHLPNGDLVELEGEDHSFQHHQDHIVAETLDYLDA